MQKVAACLGPPVGVIGAASVDHVTGPFSRSARHQRTSNHTCKRAAHQTCFQRRLNEYILCVQGWRYRRCSPRACEQWADLHLAQDVRMVLSLFSRWSAPTNTAIIPPEFLVKSAYIYGDSVSNCSGSGAPGIVRRVSSYFCTYLI
jgi:hypothetical protein